MNPTLVAHRLREQLDRFSGIFYPRFSKPQGRFLRQMIYGIEAAQDVKLSAITRELGESIALKKTSERLSHHLQAEGMDQTINEAIAQYAASYVKPDTLIVVDPTDVRKAYARRMPFLATVRDGSSGTLVPGYWGCIAVSCEAGARRVVPLHQRLWSAKAPDFGSENIQLLQIIDTIRAATGQRGIYVMDRGGDRQKLFSPLLDRDLRFLVRICGDRDLYYRGRRSRASELAKGCSMRYAERIAVHREGRKRNLHLEYGSIPVRLPRRPEQLYLVVVRGFGSEPLLILTNVPITRSRTSAWFIVEAYLTRWRVEETIRFIKQSYHLEDLRVLDYQRLRNLMALVLAAVVFSAVWLGRSLKLSILTAHVTNVSKRFFGVPDFHYYALADGIARLLSRLGSYAPCATPHTPPPDHQLTFLFSSA